MATKTEGHRKLHFWTRNAEVNSQEKLSFLMEAVTNLKLRLARGYLAKMGMRISGDGPVGDWDGKSAGDREFRGRSWAKNLSFSNFLKFFSKKNYANFT